MSKSIWKIAYKEIPVINSLEVEFVEQNFERNESGDTYKITLEQINSLQRCNQIPEYVEILKKLKAEIVAHGDFSVKIFQY